MLLLCQRGGNVGWWLLLLLDVVFVADGAESVVAGVAVKATAVSALNRVLLHLVGITVHCLQEKRLKQVTLWAEIEKIIIK